MEGFFFFFLGFVLEEVHISIITVVSHRMDMLNMGASPYAFTRRYMLRREYESVRVMNGIEASQ